MSSMTLIDVRDWHRKCATMCRRTNEPSLAELHDKMADTIDAHLAGMGEPVAWMCESVNGYKVFSAEGQNFPCNAGKVIPLYTAPPIDLAAVREATQDIREWCDMYIGGGNLPPLVENLEAAIKGVA